MDIRITNVLSTNGGKLHRKDISKDKITFIETDIKKHFPFIKHIEYIDRDNFIVEGKYCSTKMFLIKEDSSYGETNSETIYIRNLSSSPTEKTYYINGFTN